MFFSSNKFQIAGVACAVPDDLERAEVWNEYFGENAVKKFVKSTGVEQHYIENRLNMTVSDLCCEAAKYLIQKKVFQPREIDAVIFMSYRLDYEIPATAFVIQHRLGLPEECVCLDVPLGCSAYPNGFYLAGSMIESGCETILLLHGESANKRKDSPAEIPLLHGAAGTATLIRRQKGGELTGLLRSYGEEFKKIIIPYGGHRHSVENLAKEIGYEKACELDRKFYMDGYEIMLFGLGKVVRCIKDLLKYLEKTSNDFDYLVLHQSNKLIITSIADRLKVPAEKVLMSIDKYANTSGASIPTTLCHCFGDSTETTPKRVLAAGYGVGLSVGVLDFIIQPDICFPVIKTKNRFDDGISMEDFA